MPRALVVPLALAACLLGCDEKRAPDTSAPKASADPEGYVRLKPGRFVMGSETSERCRESDEAPVDVVVTHALVVGKYEVTQRQFQGAMGHNPSFRKNCDSCPVDSVTHHEASAYCNSLSEKQGLAKCYRCSGDKEQTRCEPLGEDPFSCPGYRLPSEAEWEYAARAGTRTASYAGNITSCMGSDRVADGIAWYKASSLGRSHPVGEKEANRWGLFDVMGNVYEWTADWYAVGLVGGSDPRGAKEGKERVLRGGSWYHNAEHARSANRHAFRPGKRLSYVGFRCVKTLGSKVSPGRE